MRRTSRQALIDGLTGATVTSIGRRGKYIICSLDTGRRLMIHLRMSGRVLVSQAGTPRPDHTHVVLHLAGAPAQELWFVDPRTFGEMVVFDPDHVDVELPELARLGLDPITDGLSVAQLGALVRGARPAAWRKGRTWWFVREARNSWTARLRSCGRRRPMARVPRAWRPICRQKGGVASVINTAVSTFGPLDVLVNSVALARGGDLENDERRRLAGSVRPDAVPATASRLAVPHLRQQGGAIVIVSSIFGRESGGRMTYNAVKAAEISLTKSLALQLAKDHIRVVSVAPGSILFEGGSWWKRQQADRKGIADFIAKELPFGRFGRPDEVGAAIAFLASPKASWVSGTTVVVDCCQSRMF